MNCFSRFFLIFLLTNLYISKMVAEQEQQEQTDQSEIKQEGAVKFSTTLDEHIRREVVMTYGGKVIEGCRVIAHEKDGMVIVTVEKTFEDYNYTEIERIRAMKRIREVPPSVVYPSIVKCKSNDSRIKCKFYLKKEKFTE